VPNKAFPLRRYHALRLRDGACRRSPLCWKDGNSRTILLSDEIGKWAGAIAKARLPDEFLVDYVRVYDLVEKK
jgi:hypothetical protein